MIKLTNNEIKIIKIIRKLKRISKSRAMDDLIGILFLIIGCMIFMYIAQRVGY